jgi:hypothetical protein
MRATNFELRYPTLTRVLLVGLAVCTYFLDRDDVIWRLIRNSPSSRMLEHAFFFLAAVLVGLGSVLCTRSRASSRRHSGEHRLGELAYAIGLGSLFPLSGAVFLVVTESIRLLRLGSAETPLSMESSRCLPFLICGDERRAAARFDPAMNASSQWSLAV